MTLINAVAVAEILELYTSCIKHWRENKFYWIINFTGYFPYLLFCFDETNLFEQKNVKVARLPRTEFLHGC